VLDDTGLTGVYEFDMQWSYGKKDELDKLLAENGLMLLPARRKAEFLRVVPAGAFKPADSHGGRGR